jgi:hypothetical protein
MRSFWKRNAHQNFSKLEVSEMAQAWNGFGAGHAARKALFR